MKNSLFILLLFTIHFAISQDKDILDTVAVKSCSCIEESDWAENDRNDIEMTLGLCIIEAALPYKEEISRLYDIDFVDLGGASGEKLGELVAIRMMNHCPDLMIQIGELIIGSMEEEEEEFYLSASGTITKENKDPFLILTVVDDNNTEQKFIWLTDFPGSENLLKLEKLKLALYNLEVQMNSKDGLDEAKAKSLNKKFSKLIDEINSISDNFGGNYSDREYKS